MNEYVILKRFGILEVNQKVRGHMATSDLWHVYFGEGWHAVPAEDIIQLN